jgi:hypothetical protein
VVAVGLSFDLVERIAYRGEPGGPSRLKGWKWVADEICREYTLPIGGWDGRTTVSAANWDTWCLG